MPTPTLPNNAVLSRKATNRRTIYHHLLNSKGGLRAEVKTGRFELTKKEYELRFAQKQIKELRESGRTTIGTMEHILKLAHGKGTAEDYEQAIKHHRKFPQYKPGQLKLLSPEARAEWKESLAADGFSLIGDRGSTDKEMEDFKEGAKLIIEKLMDPTLRVSFQPEAFPKVISVLEVIWPGMNASVNNSKTKRFIRTFIDTTIRKVDKRQLGQPKKEEVLEVVVVMEKEEEEEEEMMDGMDSLRSFQSASGDERRVGITSSRRGEAKGWIRLAIRLYPGDLELDLETVFFTSTPAQATASWNLTEILLPSASPLSFRSVPAKKNRPRSPLPSIVAESEEDDLEYIVEPSVVYTPEKERATLPRPEALEEGGEINSLLGAEVSLRGAKSIQRKEGNLNPEESVSPPKVLDDEIPLPPRQEIASLRRSARLPTPLAGRATFNSRRSIEIEINSPTLRALVPGLKRKGDYAIYPIRQKGNTPARDEQLHISKKVKTDKVTVSKTKNLNHSELPQPIRQTLLDLEVKRSNNPRSNKEN